MNLAIAFPFIAAAFYGLSYILTEKILQSVNMLTYMVFTIVLGTATWLVVMAGIWHYRGESFSFPLSGPEKWTHIAVMFGAVLAGSFGWLFTIYAIKDINALYAAFGEVSYPLFVLLFGLMLFGIRYLDWTVVIGGTLIMVGSAIMIYGQSKAS